MTGSGAPSPAGGVAPLAGYTVAVASDRRRHRLADLLESVGARTVGVQAARSVAKPNPAVLQAATARCLAQPCQEVVVSSAVGLRAWIAAAHQWGWRAELVRCFAKARLLARDPAAADALRAVGMSAIFSTAGETTEELIRYLAAQPSLAGRRVVVQTDRMSLSESCEELRAKGADVIEVPTYTVAPPAELFSLRRLCDLVTRRQVDAVALLGEPVAVQLCGWAEQQGRLGELAETLRHGVPCMALAAPSAQPLRHHEIPVVLAERPYAEEVAEEVLTALPRRGLQVAAGRHRLEVRGQAVVLDGQLIAVPGGPLAVLRALARQPGQVLSPAEIRRSDPIWADVDDHAIEMAVSRLRRTLREPDLVETIVRRGYRLVT